jgi:hypothetical protein
MLRVIFISVYQVTYNIYDSVYQFTYNIYRQNNSLEPDVRHRLVVYSVATFNVSTD